MPHTNKLDSSIQFNLRICQRRHIRKTVSPVIPTLIYYHHDTWLLMLFVHWVQPKLNKDNIPFSGLQLSLMSQKLKNFIFTSPLILQCALIFPLSLRKQVCRFKSQWRGPMDQPSHLSVALPNNLAQPLCRQFTAARGGCIVQAAEYLPSPPFLLLVLLPPLLLQIHFRPLVCPPPCLRSILSCLARPCPRPWRRRNFQRSSPFMYVIRLHYYLQLRRSLIFTELIVVLLSWADFIQISRRWGWIQCLSKFSVPQIFDLIWREKKSKHDCIMRLHGLFRLRRMFLKNSPLCPLSYPKVYLQTENAGEEGMEEGIKNCGHHSQKVPRSWR